MTTDLWITGGTILVLVILSFLFSGTETGMTAVSRARLHTLAANGDARADLVARLVDAGVAITDDRWQLVHDMVMAVSRRWRPTATIAGT